MITHRVDGGRYVAESTSTGVFGDGNTQLNACICLLEVLEIRIEGALESGNIDNLRAVECDG